MIAIDSQILVYAHRQDSPWHAAAEAAVRHAAEAPAAWALPWPCVHEFLAIVTHPKIYSPPTPVERALDQVAAWLASPSVTLLSEVEGYWAELRAAVAAARISGPRIHDARVAVLCHHHGVSELWSADRDFSKFPFLTVRNPLIRSSPESPE